MHHHQELISLIDSIIINHGANNPELLKHLLELRSQAVDLRPKTNQKGDHVGVAVKIAALAKYLNNLWDSFRPPPQ